MFLYRWDGDMLRVQKDGRSWTAALPGTPPSHGEIWAHISGDERYIAFGNHRGVREETLSGASRLDRVHGIWVYDLDAGRLMTVPHRVQRTDVFWDIMFDAENALYYSDGNTFWRWRIGAESVEKLFRFQKVKGAPMGLCVSPGGRFLSYYKYRADEKRLFLYDLETGESRDLHISIFYYGWLDEEHVVWTRMGGLKVLDVKSGTNRTLLRDHKAILKRCGRDAAARISCFLQEESVFEDLDLLGSHEERLWFHLALRSFPREEPGVLGLLKRKREPLLHDGVWSVGPDGKELCFHYQVPEDCRHGYFSRLFRQGSLCWTGGDDVFRCWDGTDRRMFPAGWKPVFLPGECQ